MPGVAISWKKTNIGKKSKKKSNKNTKFKELKKISLAKLGSINKSDTSAFIKKQFFNTRAQKSNSTFYQIKKIKKNDGKIKRTVNRPCQSNFEKNELIFVPSPKDSIKKQKEKPISRNDKIGIYVAVVSMFSALTSPLISFVFGNLAAIYLFEPTFSLFAILSSVGILTSILYGAIAFSIFKNAEQDKDIKNYREFQKQRKTWLVLCLSMILLSIPLNYFLITAVFL
mgnify:CR=1 FL=1|tara:strand:- start:1076 stop:1756 length:681 start_codon:yes stop_codon:yes gene_type:complete